MSFIQGSYDQVPPVSIPGQGIYEESVVKIHRLGTKISVGEREFRYAHASEALTAGKLCTALADTDSEDTVTVAHPVGTFEVTITAASTITANQYADGYLAVGEGTGAGDQYRIKSHPAITSAETGVITLLDPLLTAWAIADTDITLYQSPYRVQESNTDQKELPVGWPLIDVTDEYYFWLLVKGPVAVLFDEAEGADADQCLLTIGSSTAGAVEIYDAAGEPVVGQRYLDTADYEDGKYQLIMAQLG